MIKIAVVDDEIQEIKMLKSFFQKIQPEIQEELNVKSFLSGEELLEEYDGSYDLICLDIELGGKDGIDIAGQIREKDENVLLLFVTNMAQLAIRGYEVQALDFLVKPLHYYTFSMKMKNAIQMIRQRKRVNIVLPNPTGFYRISSEQLYYVEVSGHYLCYHTSDGVFRQKATLREIEERLRGLSFYRCNNCYLVNLKYVDCVDRDEVQIVGERLKISRPRRKEFLQRLANYMGGVEQP